MYTPIRLAAAGAALAGTLMFGPAAVAAPTVQLVTGETTVRLSSELLDALGSLGVTPDNVLPGGLHPTDAGASVVFPIPTGELDGAGPVLEIFHSGGLTLTAGETRVALAVRHRVDARAGGHGRPGERRGHLAHPRREPDAHGGRGRRAQRGIRARRRVHRGFPDRHRTDLRANPRSRRLTGFPRAGGRQRPQSPRLGLPAALHYNPA